MSPLKYHATKSAPSACLFEGTPYCFLGKGRKDTSPSRSLNSRRRPEKSFLRQVWQKAQAENVGLGSAGLRVCDYDTGASDAFEGVDAVPRKGCEQRLENAAGVDFMTGGLPGQAGKRS